jgi:four helix bundle protein
VNKQILQCSLGDSQKRPAILVGSPIAMGLDMSRDYTKLRVFELADELVVDVYALSRALPDSERYGLQSQLRRAAVSVPTNIVEGSVRRTDKGYLRYLETSLGSACEVRYLLRLSSRLGMLNDTSCALLEEKYSAVIRQLEALMSRIASSLHARALRKCQRHLAGAKGPGAESRKL